MLSHSDWTWVPSYWLNEFQVAKWQWSLLETASQKCNYLYYVCCLQYYKQWGLIYLHRYTWTTVGWAWLMTSSFLAALYHLVIQTLQGLPLIRNALYEMRSMLILYVVLHLIITTMQPGVNNFSNVIFNTFIITEQNKNIQSGSYVAMPEWILPLVYVEVLDAINNCALWLIYMNSQFWEKQFSTGSTHWDFPQKSDKCSKRHQEVETAH